MFNRAQLEKNGEAVIRKCFLCPIWGCKVGLAFLSSIREKNDVYMEISVSVQIAARTFDVNCLFYSSSEPVLFLVQYVLCPIWGCKVGLTFLSSIREKNDVCIYERLMEDMHYLYTCLTLNSRFQVCIFVLISSEQNINLNYYSVDEWFECRMKRNVALKTFLIICNN